MAMTKKLPVLAFLMLALCTASGCSKKSDGATGSADVSASQLEADGPIEEKHGDVMTRIAVKPDGTVLAKVTTNGTTVDPEKVTGKIRARALPNGKEEEQAVTAKSGVAFATFAKLDAPLTEVRYDLIVDGKPVSGVLQVPKGGTKQLVASAETAANANVDAKGPHGGIVQVVGDELVEIVGKKGSGEVRVYFLDDNRKVVPVGRQKIKLATVGDGTEFVELRANDRNEYFIGSINARSNITRMTVVVENGADVDVAIVGYRPRTVIVVGPTAPRLTVFVVDSWDVVVIAPSPPSVIVVGKGKGKGKHGRFKSKGR